MTETPTRPARQAVCRWDAETRVWLRPEHQADCPDTPETPCAGCKPCAEAHCAFRGRCPHHVDPDAGEVTCPSCVGRVRRDLAAVELMHASMPDEAVHAGLDTEAMNLAGPAATAPQVAARRQYDDRARGWCTWPAEVDHHPYAVLGRWELALREDFGPATDLVITTAGAARYVRTLLRETHFAHTRVFEEFARDVAACRAHLEAVLQDSRVPELGSPCPSCAATQDRAPRLQKRFAKHDTTGASDTWHCPADPAHWWTERDYRERLATAYLDHATELPARELAQRVGVQLSTVRHWTTRRWDKTAEQWIEARLTSRRRGPDGRKLYPVADAQALAGGAPMRAGA